MTEERARVAWRSYHDWVLPRRAVQGILAGGLLFLFLGLVFLAIGGGVSVSGLVAAGAVLTGIGCCGLMVCLLLCLHAYFIFNVRDEAVQTSDKPWADEVTTPEIPGYAVITKPSALKSADASLRRNGGGVKKVTMAPDVALDADVRAPALRSTAGSGDSYPQVTPASPTLALASPASPGYRTLGPYALLDTGGGARGAGDASGGGRGVRTSGGSSMESFDQRSYAQFQAATQPSPHQQYSQHSLQRQRNDFDIQHQRQQLEYHRQHLMQQQQQQQQHHFRVQQQQQPQSVTYAQVQRYPIAVQHSPSPSLSSHQSSVFTNVTGSVGGGAGSQVGVGAGAGGGVTATGSSLSTAQTPSSSSSSFVYRIHTQGLHYHSGRPYLDDDDDYDNPAERTPMLSSSVQTPSSAGGKGVSFSGSLKSEEVEIPEPAPLQHPSERRPMTFEQQSSSKMSIYDNVLFPYSEADGE